MNFKVGQRVRKVAGRKSIDCGECVVPQGLPIGTCGTIDRRSRDWSGEWVVSFDSGCQRTVMPYMIAPLDDWSEQQEFTASRANGSSFSQVLEKARAGVVA